MTRLIEVLISLAIVLGLFLVISLVLPSSRHLSQKVETNRRMTIVYDTLDSLRRFNDWNPLVLHDPRMQMKLSGPESGVGARLDYSSKEPAVGNGSWEIVADEPGKSVTYAVVNPQRGHDKQMKFLLKPTGRNGRNVEITQNYDVTYGWDLMGRYAGLYVRGHVGDEMKMGLDRLAGMLASVPNVDYRGVNSKLTGLRVIERPAENLLVVNAGSIPRDGDKIQASMKSNMEWIKRTMDANNLVAVGPVRVISTEFGRENYTFDIAQAVRRSSSADSETADAGTAPLTGLKLLGPVTYVQSKPTRAATVSYTGYVMGLENAHNALRAWALTQGYEVTDRPYELYKNGIDQAFTEDGQYDIFWTVK
jgi:hypothetical protein